MTREEKEAIKGKAINDAMCSIENRVRHVYNQGFEEGKNYYIQKHDNAYNKGLEDAWECARKIFHMSASELIFTFGRVSGWVDLSASEAMAKLKEYEKQQRQEWEDDFENKQLEQLCNHLEQQKKIEKSCDNCGHRFDVSCEILDEGECCINESRWIPKQTEEKTNKSCDNCRFVDLMEHEFPCCDCYASHTFRWEPQNGVEE